MKNIKVEMAARAGFTLIEILIAIALVGIMSAVAIPAFMKHMESGNENSTKATIAAAEQATQTYMMSHNSRLPSDQAAWVKALSDDDSSFDGDLVDAWGVELKYERDRKAKNGFVITSAGADMEFGTDDDIKNTELRKRRKDQE